VEPVSSVQIATPGVAATAVRTAQARNWQVWHGLQHCTKKMNNNMLYSLPTRREVTVIAVCCRLCRRVCSVCFCSVKCGVPYDHHHRTGSFLVCLCRLTSYSPNIIRCCHS